MPQDNTPIQTDNSQMATQAPSNNDVTSPEYAAVPEGPVATQPAPADVPVTPVVSDAVVMPGAEPATTEAPVSDPVSGDIRADIATKIGENKNILVALSSDPSVDELSAAIGLSLYLDKIGKRATAIYSGATPNTLEFLKPEETFEPSADTLQDFVIALNKEKADHLRYKVDGEFVKVYITPYKHRLSEEDLEFSYGDYNVDLVIALDVANGIDLDAALREHGRIMHDASIINVTTGNPGKFGEIEWSDKKASSVSEMIARLLYEYGGDDSISKDEATAFLTGIVAATNRFSNAKTTPETMRLSSRLMESGANQVLVSKNITPDTENEIFNSAPQKTALVDEKKNEAEGEAQEEKPAKEVDPTKLDIGHDSDTKKEDQKEAKPEDSSENSSEEVNADVTKKEHTLLDDLKAAEASLAQAGAETTPENNNKTLTIENGQMKSDLDDTSKESASDESGSADSTPTEPVLPEPVTSESTEMPAPEAPALETPAVETPASEMSTSNAPALETPAPEAPALETPAPEAPALETPAVETPEENQPVLPEVSMPGGETDSNGIIGDKPEMVIAPSADFNANATDNAETNKYSKMLEDALASSNEPVEPTSAIMSEPAPGENPAVVNAPSAPANPEINGVPEMNYMPLPGTEILPPPPTPPIGDLSQGMPPADGGDAPAVASTTPVAEPVASAEQPVAQDQANDPSAFKIPGM